MEKKEQNEEKVLIYAALDEKTANDLCKLFEEKTGIKAEIALQIEQAGSITGRIKAEADSPRADVFIGGNSNYHSDLAKNNFLEQYRSPVIDEAGISEDLMGQF